MTNYMITKLTVECSGRWQSPCTEVIAATYSLHQNDKHIAFFMLLHVLYHYGLHVSVWKLAYIQSLSPFRMSVTLLYAWTCSYWNGRFVLFSNSYLFSDIPNLPHTLTGIHSCWGLAEVSPGTYSICVRADVCNLNVEELIMYHHFMVTSFTSG